MNPGYGEARERGQSADVVGGEVLLTILILILKLGDTLSKYKVA